MGLLEMALHQAKHLGNPWSGGDPVGFCVHGPLGLASSSSRSPAEVSLAIKKNALVVSGSATLSPRSMVWGKVVCRGVAF